MKTTRPKSLLVLLATLFLFAACASETTAPEGEGPTTVVTVAPIADLVQRVAGERIPVRTLIPEEQDSHTFQPEPADARALAGADLFIDAGFGLNQSVLEFAAQNLNQETTQVLFVAEEAIPFDQMINEGGDCHQGHCHGGSYNAHTWPNPVFAISYVAEIRDFLSQWDPEGKEYYAENAETLTAELEKLDEVAEEVVSSIPEENRKLVVYHDSWSYFAREYGMEVVGAIQPADFSEPSAAELRKMVEQIQDEGVPAFFGSEVFPSDVMETLAQESGAEYNADLSDDDLPGEPGDPNHSYIGMMAENLRIIAESLGGDAGPVEDLDPAVGSV